MTEMFLKDQNYWGSVAADAEAHERRNDQVSPPAVISKGELTHRRPGRMSSCRPRPLTRTQEVLFVAAAFFIGGILQMLAILYIGNILE